MLRLLFCALFVTTFAASGCGGCSGNNGNGGEAAVTIDDVDPEAVRLAGDFNEWIPDSGVVLDRYPGGGWTKFYALSPGRYEYKLVVDGKWVVDPLNPNRVKNDAGSENSVLEIDV